jgi:acyl dehydratase
MKVGDQLPEFAVPSVDPARMKTMAAVLRDPYRVHWDREATREMGLEGRVINQGPLNLSYIVNMLHSFSGPTSVRRLTVSFGQPVFDTDSVVSGGEISAIEGDRATCAVWLKRGDEIVVSGAAVIDIAHLH